jgi:hypothetical protein
MTAASSMSAISRRRPPPLDSARDGPERGRRATARTRQNIETEAAPHQLGVEPAVAHDYQEFPAGTANGAVAHSYSLPAR